MTELDRESQVALSGVVVTLESLLEGHWIKTEDVDKVKEMLKCNKAKITIPDILESIKDSNFPSEQPTIEVVQQ